MFYNEIFFVSMELGFIKNKKKTKKKSQISIKLIIFFIYIYIYVYVWRWIQVTPSVILQKLHIFIP